MRVLNIRSAGAVLLFMLGMATALAAQTDQAPARELVQYIQNARKQGLAESKIRKQAAAIGWSEAAVNEAIEFEKSGKPLPAPSAAPVAPSRVVAEAQGAAPASNPLEPVNHAAEFLPAAEKVEKPAQASAVPSTSDDYRIGAGDTLQIAVWKEPEASVPAVVVRPDGRITMPLIKDVEVAGLTPRQAEAAITAGFAKFITDPNVTVVVATINSKKVYLIGAVRKEGPLPYTYGITVIQALSEAGGLTDYAKRKRIYILRTEGGREYRLDFNYEEVIRGEHMEQNVVLLPGDTVVVPQ
jgi:polysaccharide export outer membrane protein